MLKSREWRTIALRTYRLGRTGKLPVWEGDRALILMARSLCEQNRVWLATRRTVAEDRSGHHMVTEALQVRDRG